MKLSNLFGPLALIIGKQIEDVMKFLVLLLIYLFGFIMLTMALNEPYELTNNIGQMSEMEINEELKKSNFTT